MSHTNQTQHYQLPQYVGTDILNPLTDTNEAYQKIDETMYNVSQEAGQASSEVAQAVATVEAMNQRVAVVENEATELASGVEQTRLMLAEPFNALKSGGYKTGDYVIEDNKLYKFIKPHMGAWSASDVEEISVTDVLKIAQNMIAPYFVATEHYEAGAWVIYDNKLYVFTADHDGAWVGTDVDEIDIGYAVDRIEGTLHYPTVADLEVVCGYTSDNKPVYRKHFSGIVTAYTDSNNRRAFNMFSMNNNESLIKAYGTVKTYRDDGTMVSESIFPVTQVLDDMSTFYMCSVILKQRGDVFRGWTDVVVSSNITKVEFDIIVEFVKS